MSEVRRQQQLLDIRRARAALVRALPVQLQRTTRASATFPTRTIEDHAAAYVQRMWGPQATDDDTVAGLLQSYRTALTVLLEDETGLILKLLGREEAGLAFEAVRKVLCGQGNIPSSDKGFKDYMGTAVNYALAAQKAADKAPLVDPDTAGRPAGGARSVGVPLSTVTISGEESLARYTEEEDPKWVDFFGYGEEEHNP